MNVIIPKETESSEKRVAATPETVKKIKAAGLEVWVESRAGEASSIPDAAYESAGAHIEKDTAALYKKAGVILKVQRPLSSSPAGKNEVELIPSGAFLISLLQPLSNPELVKKLAERNVTALAMDMIPRIARAQRLDALSSQSNVAGYKAVIMAADSLPKIASMMMTAAGTITPARFLVIGAGVAGLQAIATARRLGAIVEAFDTRPVVKEQVESLGARFVALEVSQETEDKGGYAKELSKDAHEREMALIAKHCEAADVVITTAQIPGKKSPLLITEETVKKMREGSVIVDLAVEGGGNCEATEAGKRIVKHGVTIIGERNVPSLMAAQSSQLYSRNIMGLLLDLVKGGEMKLDLEDDIIKGSLITREGKIVHPALQAATAKV